MITYVYFCDKSELGSQSGDTIILLWSCRQPPSSIETEQMTFREGRIILHIYCEMLMLTETPSKSNEITDRLSLSDMSD